MGYWAWKQGEASKGGDRSSRRGAHLCVATLYSLGPPLAQKSLGGRGEPLSCLPFTPVPDSVSGTQETLNKLLLNTRVCFLSTCLVRGTLQQQQQRLEAVHQGLLQPARDILAVLTLNTVCWPL